ncbi:hypothetical protein ACJX0J_040522, partial [Zea mays]
KGDVVRGWAQKKWGKEGLAFREPGLGMELGRYGVGVIMSNFLLIDISPSLQRFCGVLKTIPNSLKIRHFLGKRKEQNFFNTNLNAQLRMSPHIYGDYIACRNVELVTSVDIPMYRERWRISGWSQFAIHCCCLLYASLMGIHKGKVYMIYQYLFVIKCLNAVYSLLMM